MSPTNRPDWPEYFMAIAKIISTRSTCNSRPIGCVIVRDKQILSTGYNGAVAGAPHCIDQADLPDGRPFCYRRSINAADHEKQNYCVSSHAEANAIAQAAREGISLKDSTVYVTVAPCFSCIKQLAMAQVRHVYYEIPYESADARRDDYWGTQAARLFTTFSRLQISDETAKPIVEALAGETSFRRLSGTK